MYSVLQHSLPVSLILVYSGSLLNFSLDIYDVLSFELHSFKSQLGERITNISLGLSQENYTNLPRFT